MKYMDITAWLASAYDFYARVVKAKHIEIILELETCQRRTMSKQNIGLSKQNHTICFSVIWPK